MKKIFLMLGTALVALTSCSESEVLDVVEERNAGPIGFSTWVGKQTRAAVTDNTVDVLKGSWDGTDGGFVVYGGYKADGSTAYVPVFNGTESTSSLVRFNGSKEENTGSWQYNTVYYWQPNTNYRFVAYAPLIGSNLVKVGNTEGHTAFDYDKNQLTITNFRADGTTDLVVAASCNADAYIDADAQISNNKNVELTFKHALSKVCFTFENGWHNNVTVTIANIILSGLKTTATLKTDPNILSSGVEYDDWEFVSPAEVISGLDPSSSNYLDNNTWSSALTNEKYHFENFLIPQTLAKDGKTDIKLTFNVTISYNGSTGGPVGPDFDKNTAGIQNYKTITAFIPVNSITQWNPGFLYTYSIKITGETFGLSPIKFELKDVQPWGNESANNVVWDVDGTK